MLAVCLSVCRGLFLFLFYVSMQLNVINTHLSLCVCSVISQGYDVNLSLPPIIYMYAWMYVCHSFIKTPIHPSIRPPTGLLIQLRGRPTYFLLLVHHHYSLRFYLFIDLIFVVYFFLPPPFSGSYLSFQILRAGHDL
ncbi:hypothetical protein F4778DRAFT_718465 [Xylariomycetidae sp. FL2044]|nr:hypothetical protein F4778DRAFT_718465 [Xylariomycetidae sp. FL2044]